MSEFFHFDIAQWITTIGFVGVVLIIFVETGLFVGFFLPGDSLIFTAGLLASKGIFPIKWLVPSLIVAAFLGYTLAYWFGKRLGRWLMSRKDHFWFKKSYIYKAEEFYEKHGGKAIILGRLVPIVRTFIPIAAGMARMTYRDYFMYNLLGALLWGGGLCLAGYYLGALIPDADKYILLVIVIVVFLSFLPMIWPIIKERRARRRK